MAQFSKAAQGIGAPFISRAGVKVAKSILSVEKESSVSTHVQQANYIYELNLHVSEGCHHRAIPDARVFWYFAKWL